MVTTPATPAAHTEQQGPLGEGVRTEHTWQGGAVPHARVQHGDILTAASLPHVATVKTTLIDAR